MMKAEKKPLPAFVIWAASYWLRKFDVVIHQSI